MPWEMDDLVLFGCEYEEGVERVCSDIDVAESSVTDEIEEVSES